MNLNLAHNSVGFYQLSKLSCIPITILIETVLKTRQQILNTTMVFSLSLILLGMTIVLVHEIQLNTIGLFWAACAVLSTSVAQVLFSPLQKELGMSSIQLLFHTSPILTIGSYLLIPIFEDIPLLLSTSITFSLIVNILLSCMMAVLLNITNYFVLSMTSPLTYQIINHCKTLLVMLSGVVFLGELPTTKVMFGMLLAVAGVVVYSEENRRQGAMKQQQAGIVSSTTTSSGGGAHPTSAMPLKTDDNTASKSYFASSGYLAPSGFATVKNYQNNTSGHANVEGALPSRTSPPLPAAPPPFSSPSPYQTSTKHFSKTPVASVV